MSDWGMTRLSSGAKIIGGRYFNFKTGPILPECIFSKSLRYFGNTGNRNIHSRHIGGVTLLFKAGVPQHIIQRLVGGRQMRITNMGG